MSTSNVNRDCYKASQHSNYRLGTGDLKIMIIPTSSMNNIGTQYSGKVLQVPSTVDKSSSMLKLMYIQILNFETNLILKIVLITAITPKMGWPISPTAIFPQAVSLTRKVKSQAHLISHWLGQTNKLLAITLLNMFFR